MARGHREFSARPQQQGPVPAFRVVETDDVVARTVSTFDEKTRTITRKEVKQKGGFYVVFPRGHSLFYPTWDKVCEAGFGDVVEMVSIGGDTEVNSEHEGRTPRARVQVETAQ